jgi:hypothetical protein
VGNKRTTGEAPAISSTETREILRLFRQLSRADQAIALDAAARLRRSR